jgi:hypothetical protein
MALFHCATFDTEAEGVDDVIDDYIVSAGDSNTAALKLSSYTNLPVRVVHNLTMCRPIYRIPHFGDKVLESQKERKCCND